MSSPPEYLSIDRKFAVKANYAGITKTKIDIILPSNILLKSLPQNFFIESDHLASSIKYNKEGNKITREQIIKNSSIDVSVQDITKYKDMWDEIFKAHKQGIVLRVY